jgi:hypothetical protein
MLDTVCEQCYREEFCFEFQKTEATVRRATTALTTTTTRTSEYNSNLVD